jgi:hypothetical protein
MSSDEPRDPDGVVARWATWDGEHHEDLVVRWENRAWTVEGRVGRERVHYVLRLSPDWQVRQLLLFRDLDEADLWLATDGSGRWGEVGGATRDDLSGCTELLLTCTPFTLTPPVRRLPVAVGDAVEVLAAVVDVETLGVVPRRHRFERLTERRWRVESASEAGAVDVDVDEHGLVIDLPGRYRRASPPRSGPGK